MQANKCKKLVIASDHIGIQLKEAIKERFQEMGIEYVDMGTNTSERVDYPDYAYQVAKFVAGKEFDKGVLICGTGVGMSIAANKIHGIRCVVCSETYSAVLSRRHNDTNILALGARVLGRDLALKILEEWIETSYEGERHKLRVDKITAMENGYK